jgi:hypothetical protein
MVLLDKDRTMDNVQKHNICIEICILAKGSPQSIELVETRFLISGEECPKPGKILNHDTSSGFGIYKLTGKIQIHHSN